MLGGGHARVKLTHPTHLLLSLMISTRRSSDEKKSSVANLGYRSPAWSRRPQKLSQL